MEWALQNFGYISHSITTCRTDEKEKHWKDLDETHTHTQNHSRQPSYWLFPQPLKTQNKTIMENTKNCKYRETYTRLLKYSRHGETTPSTGEVIQEARIASHVTWKDLHHSVSSEASLCTRTAAWRILTQHLRHHIERREYGRENFVSYCSQTLNRWFQFIDHFCVC